MRDPIDDESSPMAERLLAAPRGLALCVEVLERLDPGLRTEVIGASASEGRRLAERIGSMASAVGGWSDPLDFAYGLDAAVSNSMGWQGPRSWELETRDPRVRALLLPIAEAVLAAPAAAWWSAPIDLEALRATSLVDEHERPVGPRLAGAAGRLEHWRATEIRDEGRAARERPSDPRAAWSGTWWSTPGSSTGLPTTTRPVGTAGSAKLLWEEDSFGQRRARVWSLRANRPVRIHEVGGPAAWIDLVRRYPFEVTAGRRHDWYRVTGRDRRWFVPDWAAVAEHWDAVHVSVLGYLLTATRLLELDDERAAVLAGWDPDQAWWLGDALRFDGEPADWCNPDSDDGSDFGWRVIA